MVSGSWSGRDDMSDFGQIEITGPNCIETGEKRISALRKLSDQCF